jgi:hypothetical protein
MSINPIHIQGIQTQKQTPSDTKKTPEPIQDRLESLRSLIEKDTCTSQTPEINKLSNWTNHGYSKWYN